MADAMKTVRLGTRKSALARWQTDHVAGLLHDAWPQLKTDIQHMVTKGDQVLDKALPLIGGKGLFTAELEQALHNHEVDLAVHSLKDLPTEAVAGLTVGAVPVRAPLADVLISRTGQTLDELPEGAAIGTSSRRRAAQLLHYRPDLRMIDIRGNVDTRISKVKDPDGPYDAIVLAEAGVTRLERGEVITERLPLEIMMPAPGQGALAVQCRDEPESLELLAPIQHVPTLLAVSAERAFLNGLGGGCSVPVAAHAMAEGDQLTLHGRVTTLNGSYHIDVSGQIRLGAKASDLQRVQQLGARLAQEALSDGASAILETLL